MPRLIDADALYILLSKEAAHRIEHSDVRQFDVGKTCGIIYARDVMGDAPAIDPVKHGRWVDFRAHDKDWIRDDGKSVFMECSECHEKLCRNLMLSVNYCPSCGCKMGESKLVDSHQFKCGEDAADQNSEKPPAFDGGNGEEPCDCKRLRGGPDGDAHVV